MMMTLLQCFIAKCEKCGAEARIKIEGPPYYLRWKYDGDGCDIAGWQIPNCDANQFTAIRCPDYPKEATP